MSDALKQAAVTAAVNAATTVNVTKTDLNPGQVADIAAKLPPAAAMESLGPQMVRYGIAIAAAYLAGKGADATDIAVLQQYGEPVVFGLIALSMPAYRIARTFFARRTIKRN